MWLSLARITWAWMEEAKEWTWELRPRPWYVGSSSLSSALRSHTILSISSFLRLVIATPTKYWNRSSRWIRRYQRRSRRQQHPPCSLDVTLHNTTTRQSPFSYKDFALVIVIVPWSILHCSGRAELNDSIWASLFQFASWTSKWTASIKTKMDLKSICRNIK